MGKFTDFDLDLNFEKGKNGEMSNYTKTWFHDTKWECIEKSIEYCTNITKWEYCSVSCDCSPSASDMTACAAHAKEKQNTMMRC